HDRRLAAAAVLGLAVHRTAGAAVVTPLHEDVGGAVVLPAALVAATVGLDRRDAVLGYHGCLRGVSGLGLPRQAPGGHPGTTGPVARFRLNHRPARSGCGRPRRGTTQTCRATRDTPGAAPRTGR